MKRYVVMVRENYPGAQITEYCRCLTQEGANVKATYLAHMVVTGRYFHQMRKYNHVEVVDLGSRQKDDMLKPSISRARKPLYPDKNVRPASENAFGADIAGNLLLVCKQIDAYKLLGADHHGEQAAARTPAQERPPLPQRQSEAEP